MLDNIKIDSMLNFYF